MKVTRAEFLAACGAGMIGTAVKPHALDGAAAAMTNDVRSPALNDFRNQVGTTFEVDPSGESQPVVLVEVRDRSIEWRVEQFSLLFRGAADAARGEGTYAFHHVVLGGVPLFVVPLWPAGARAQYVHYEACISRFRSLEARHGD